MKKEKIDFYKKKLAKNNIFIAKDIAGINHRPHPVTIGTKHITYAADHCGGMLTQDVIEKIGCAHPKCKLPVSEHTSDTVLFLQLTRNLENKEAGKELFAIKKQMIADKIDGVLFVDDKKKFRIAKPISESK